MPSTRSQAGVDTPAGGAAEVAEALEELSAEIAARNGALVASRPACVGRPQKTQNWPAALSSALNPPPAGRAERSPGSSVCVSLPPL